MSRPEFYDILLKLKEKLSKAEDDYDNETDFQDYGLDDDDMDGMSIMGEDEMAGDDADAWLKEQEAKQASPQESQKEGKV